MENKERTDRPDEVVIEVTSRCNYHCEGCFNRASFAEEGRAVELKNDLIFSVIRSAKESGVPMVRFSGGEPLLNNEILTYLRFAKEQGLRVRLNTNAALINESNVDQITEVVDSLLVSFNGHDEESDYSWTKKEGAFKKKLHALKLLSQKRIELRAGTVLTTPNIISLEKIYDELSVFNIAHWEVYRPVVSGPAEPIKEEINLIIDKLISLSVKFKKIIPIANALPFCLYHDLLVIDLLSFGARADDGHSRFIVDPRGFAKPSYFINENLGDPTNIKEVWESSFLKKMRNLEFLPNECNECLYRDRCKGGSRFRAKNVFGSYEARDPLMVIR